MKAGVQRGLRRFLIWVNRISLIAMAVCGISIVTASVIRVDYGKFRKTYLLTPFERERTDFEESQLYDDVIQYQIADITRMCVIRNQMETDGKYDPKKEIDISEFANRENVMKPDQAVVKYYLDDLIKWGNYKLDYETVHSSAGDVQVLYQRYKTVEGKELTEYADNDSDYHDLVENLQKATSELFINYSEYMKYMDTYNHSDSNMIYCYRMNDNGKMCNYSNTGRNLNTMTADEISSMFSKYHRFIVYYPDRMQMSTNTRLDAKDMRSMLSDYEYSFQDDARVWIGIPETYENPDLMREAYTLYSRKEPAFLLWVLGLAVSVLLFVITAVAGTRQEIRFEKSGEKKVSTAKVEKVPLEVTVILVLAVLLVYEITLKTIANEFFNMHPLTMMLVLAAVILLTHLFMAPLYLSVVRKTVSRRLFKESLIYRLFAAIKKGALETYDHGNIFFRTWVPYLIFIFVNLILFMTGIWGIAAALILDLILGVYLFVVTKERQKIIKVIETIKEGDFTSKVSTKHLHGDNLQLANSVNHIGSAIQDAVEKSMKDEKMKADLITNVSHDLKTPLTSIISYVDLIKHERIDNENIRNYVAVLDAKSQRLKQLTDDLVEASKISSGNITLQLTKIDLVEFVNQTLGEFSEKFEEKQLQIVTELPESSVFIKADSRHLFRVIENLYHNIYKYAMQGTRVYLNVDTVETEAGSKVHLSLKNISEQPLNVSAEELTERFVQGDEARSSDGSGLGLSIAKNLVQSFGGSFEIQLDGDLFKVILGFDVME